MIDCETTMSSSTIAQRTMLLRRAGRSVFVAPSTVTIANATGTATKRQQEARLDFQTQAWPMSWSKLNDCSTFRLQPISNSR